MARQRKPTPATVPTVTVPRQDVVDAIAALDASEQLLELLKGPLNADGGLFTNDLLCAFQDHVIVSARIRLVRAVDR